MTTLNLIYPNKSDIQYEAMIFPDGQPHIKVDTASLTGVDKAGPIRIFSRISNSNDLLTILFAKNVLDYQEFGHIELHISYLLTARMDRVMLEGEPFSLKVIAGILNTAGFKKVLIFDPHSEVSTALIDRSYTVTNHAFVADMLADYRQKHSNEHIALVSPDAGALKKIHKLANYLDIQHVVACSKERDLKTGQLSHFDTTADDLTGVTCIIVDDICDGGGTFVGVAKLLRSKGAATIVLVVSHGIFSKGTHIEGLDEVYTTDSYRCVEGLHCLPVERYFP